MMDREKNYMKSRTRRLIRKIGLKMIEKRLGTSEIQDRLYEKFGYIVPLSTISTWKKEQSSWKFLLEDIEQ